MAAFSGRSPVVTQCHHPFLHQATLVCEVGTATLVLYRWQSEDLFQLSLMND